MNQAPTPPEPHDCCGNGCDPCIWDIYYAELRKWQEAQKSKTLTNTDELLPHHPQNLT